MCAVCCVLCCSLNVSLDCGFDYGYGVGLQEDLNQICYDAATSATHCAAVIRTVWLRLEDCRYGTHLDLGLHIIASEEWHS